MRIWALLLHLSVRSFAAPAEVEYSSVDWAKCADPKTRAETKWEVVPAGDKAVHR